MNESVYITRQFNKFGECICIYGVYANETNALNDLKENEHGLTFNDQFWIWEDKASGFFYRIDAYTVQ
jgi:hypothetical protein